MSAPLPDALVPELPPGTVVVLDNLATHKNVQAAKGMREAGCWFLRRIGALTFTDIFSAIAEIRNLYSPEEFWNYFNAAGYVAG